MKIKAQDTFWQRRKIRGMQPILMEVLEVEEIIGVHDICKVRWHILGKDAISIQVIPMATIKRGHFADFVPISRDKFLKAIEILSAPDIDYCNKKRRIHYLMKEYQYTDDEPWVLPNNNT